MLFIARLMWMFGSYLRGLIQCVQAVLQRTVADYEKAGFDPQSSSLEIRLIHSQDDIRSPQIKYKAEKYT